MHEEGRRAERHRIDLLAIALVGGILCGWTWRSWADPLVDYGRELYGAWRLSEGDRLQLDLAWLQGPLSVEWNAVLFRVFGASYRTLFLADLAVLAAVVALVRALLRQTYGRWTATVGALVLLAIFAFGQYGVVGNYCFAAPYSHELTHGFLLALGGLWALERAACSRRVSWIVLAGTCTGLLVLTKAEVFLAGALASLARLAMLLAGRPGARERARTAGCFALAASVPIFASYLAFLPERTSAEAWRATFGAFAHVGREDVLELPFYRSGLGVDAPAENIDLMLRWTLGFALALGVPALLARGLRSRHRAAGAIAFVASALVFALAREKIAWRELGRPLPLLALAFAIDAFVELVRAGSKQAASREAARLALSIFALVLLAKIVLAARLVHYGFVLALPASLLLVAFMFDVLPRWVAARGGAASALRAWFLGLCAVAAAVHLGWTRDWLQEDRHVLGEGADRMRVATRGKLAGEALEAIRARTAPDDTVLVLPEGVTLNYLARRRSPTRYPNFMPPEILLWGEETILAELEARPPALIAVVHKDTSEYGFPTFGRDYGTRLWGWVQAHYVEVERFGDPPLVDDRFGIALLEPR